MLLGRLQRTEDALSDFMQKQSFKIERKEQERKLDSKMVWIHGGSVRGFASKPPVGANPIKYHMFDDKTKLSLCGRIALADATQAQAAPNADTVCGRCKLSLTRRKKKNG